MTRIVLFVFHLIVYNFAFAQAPIDTTRPKELKAVIIKAWQRRDISHLPDEQNGFLATGKKNEVVTLSATNANVAIKTGRQLFAKIPGVFVYDMDFKKINEFDLPTEGWGLTSDGKNMIVSDGSNNLYYYNPTNFSLVETKAISEAGSPAFNLNELEYINGYIYANKWQYPYILKIDPAQSTVVGKIDLTDISKRIRSQSPGAEFLNGIAYDSTNNKMYVTGKYWPTLFEIQMAQ